MGRVVEAVSADPALTAKILRIANSAYYGRRRKTENLRQAIVLLGLNGTLSLALSFSLVDELRGLQSGGLDYDLFWRRSLAAATCARALGTQIQLRRREELFLAGLLQDIGMLALDKTIPTLYRDIRPVQGDHREVQRVEQLGVGADHAMVGAWLLNYWNLPKLYQSAVGGSHEFDVGELSPEERLFAQCVFVSGPLADIWFHDDRQQATEEAARLADEQLGITREQLVPLLKVVRPFHPKAQGSDIRDAAARARHPGYAVMPMASVQQLVRLQRAVRRRLSAIRVPALIAHGVHDRTAAPRDARQLHAEIAGSRLLWLERSGHVVPVDHDGRQLAERARDFLLEQR